MADELSDVKPGDVTFFQKLKKSENSVVFKVAVHGKICVMKVVSKWTIPLLETSLKVISIILDAVQIATLLITKLISSSVNLLLING